MRHNRREVVASGGLGHRQTCLKYSGRTFGAHLRTREAYPPQKVGLHGIGE